MFLDIAVLVLGLVIILISCELFTNGIEWLGKKLRVGDGVVGSLFSAVGTCLPETSIPIIAILLSGNMKKSNDISIGAIIGAPFMLSTLAFFITGASVLAFRRRRRSCSVMNINTKVVTRDISFFITAYSVGLAATFVKYMTVRYIITGFLAIYYLYYIALTIRSDNVSHVSLEKLYMREATGIRSNKLAIPLQLALAFVGIIFGAELFVRNIGELSKLVRVSTLVLSMIIAPVATELPEKFNSIIWIGKGKDTLALGNITGAMVFQSCIPVSIGISATSWQLDHAAVICGILAIASALFTLIWIRTRGRLNPLPLMAGGLFYAVFILFLFKAGIT